MSPDLASVLLAMPVLLIAVAVQEHRRLTGRRIAEALDGAHLSRKQAAAELDMHEGQFSRTVSDGLLTLADAAYLAARQPALADAFATLFPGIVTLRSWADAQTQLIRAVQHPEVQR